MDLGYDDLFYSHLIMLMQALIIGLFRHLKHHITEQFESDASFVYTLAFTLSSSLYLITMYD